MPPERDPRATIRLTPGVLGVWRRERRDRPVAYRLALIGIGTLTGSAVLVAMHLGVIAEFVGGLAVLPLSLATFLRLLPPPPWTDERTDGRGHGQGADSGPWPPDGSGMELDWEKFERQFNAFVQDRSARPRR
jgi:hypothetical protein